jgi:hypothetical protein
MEINNLNDLARAAEEAGVLFRKSKTIAKKTA